MINLKAKPLKKLCWFVLSIQCTLVIFDRSFLQLGSHRIKNRNERSLGSSEPEIPKPSEMILRFLSRDRE